MTTPLIRLALCAAALALGTAPPALAADPPTTPNVTLFRDGTPLTFGATLSPPYVLRYGGSGWVIHVRALIDMFNEVVVSETGAFLYACDFCVINGLHPAIDNDSEGRVATVGFHSGSSHFDPDGTGVFIDDVVVIETGDPLVAPGVPALAEWTSTTSMDLLEPDQLVIRGTYGVPPLFDDVEVLVRYDLDGAGAAINPDVVYQEGDLVDGRAVLGVASTYDRSWTVNDNGQVITTLSLGGGGIGIPAALAIVLDDTILIEHDKPSPVPGLEWHLFTTDCVDLNEQGDTAIATKLEGSRDILLKNGQVLAMEGDPAPGLPGSILLAVKGAHLAEDGSLLWYGKWVDNQGSGHEGFFVDDQLMVQAGGFPAGNTLVDGLSLFSVNPDPARFDIAEDGSRFAFEGDDALGNWGVFEVSLAPWVSQGGGLAGTGGLKPLVVGSGELTAGSTASLELSQALPGAVTHLVLGLSELAAPLKGGVLCPNPDVLLLGLPVDGAGTFTASGIWPASVPSGATFWSQFWTVDPGAPKGVSVSNCLRATTP
jgi:hypothetical protein